MAAQEDNFEIDIYGDGDDYQGEEQQNQQQHQQQQQMDETVEQHGMVQDSKSGDHNTKQEPKDAMDHKTEGPTTQQTSATTLKRKEGVDERPLDIGATAALTVSELHWWINDDDIRGWANQSSCEDELKEITFSEHKVNGKSKGYVRVWCCKLGRSLVL